MSRTYSQGKDAAKYVCRALYKVNPTSAVVNSAFGVGSLEDAIAAVIGQAGKRAKDDIHAIEIHLTDNDSGTTTIFNHGPDVYVVAARGPASVETPKARSSSTCVLQKGTKFVPVAINKSTVDKAPWRAANAA